MGAGVSFDACHKKGIMCNYVHVNMYVHVSCEQACAWVSHTPAPSYVHVHMYCT